MKVYIPLIAVALLAAGWFAVSPSTSYGSSPTVVLTQDEGEGGEEEIPPAEGGPDEYLPEEPEEPAEPGPPDSPSPEPTPPVPPEGSSGPKPAPPAGPGSATPPDKSSPDKTSPDKTSPDKTSPTPPIDLSGVTGPTAFIDNSGEVARIVVIGDPDGPGPDPTIAAGVVGPTAFVDATGEVPRIVVVGKAKLPGDSGPGEKLEIIVEPEGGTEDAELDLEEDETYEESPEIYEDSPPEDVEAERAPTEPRRREAIIRKRNFEPNRPLHPQDA